MRLATLRTLLAGAVGTASLAVAALLAFAPASLPGLSTLERAAALVPTWAWVGLLALAVAGYGGLRLLAGRATARRPEPLAPRPPEQSRRDRTAVVGGDFDRRAAAAGTPDQPVDDLAADLRAVAVAVHARAAGVDRETARERVATGAWTDDARAAALLGERAPGPPVSTRLWDWLRPEPAARYRLYHAVAAIEDAWARAGPAAGGGVSTRPGDGFGERDRPSAGSGAFDQNEAPGEGRP